MTVRILVGDCRRLLADLPAESAHCCITSPPYFGLRSYGNQPSVWGGDSLCEHEWGEALSRKAGGGQPGEKVRWQHIGAGVSGHPSADVGAFCLHCSAWLGSLGLEPDYPLYVEHIVEVFREVYRVLRRDGVLWLNLGDCYATGAGKVGEHPGGGEQGERWKGYRGTRPGSPKHAPEAMGPMTQPNRLPQPGLKTKDLIGIPWRVAFALQAEGWYLRLDVIWSKPNPMPESVQDRPTRAHEYVFLLTKSERYWYDAAAIREPLSEASIQRIEQPTFAQQTGGPKDYANGVNENRSMRRTLENFAAKQAKVGKRTYTGFNQRWDEAEDAGRTLAGRNRRSVWTIATQPFSGAHFAVFPTTLVEPLGLAGSPERCCPTCGKGWVRVVEKERHAGSSPNRNDGLSARYDGCSLRRDASNGRSHSVVLAEQWKPGCTCPDNDGSARAVVLDPFGGAGTVGLVADRLGRDSILCELNPEYARMAEERIRSDAPLFADVSSTG